MITRALPVWGSCSASSCGMDKLPEPVNSVVNSMAFTLRSYLRITRRSTCMSASYRPDPRTREPWGQIHPLWQKRRSRRQPWRSSCPVLCADAIQTFSVLQARTSLTQLRQRPANAPLGDRHFLPPLGRNCSNETIPLRLTRDCIYEHFMRQSTNPNGLFWQARGASPKHR